MSIKRSIPYFIPLFLFFSCGRQSVADAQVSATAMETSPPVKKAPNLARFEKEIVQFEANDKTAAPAAGGILFVGSSTIRLWKTLAEDMAPLPVVNRGFGGATIAEVNHYFRRIVARYKPSLLVFYAGENDLAVPDVSVDSVVGDFDRFRDSMRVYLPQCHVYFVGVKPSPARWAYEDKFLEANRRFRAICEKDPRYTYVDVQKTMLGPDGRPKKDIYRADSLHMNAGGYKAWTAILKPELKADWKNLQRSVSRQP